MISSKLVKAIKSSKARQYDLAQQAGLTQSQLSQMIHGAMKVRIGDERIVRIGEALGIKSDECFISDPYLLGIWKIKDIFSSSIYGSGKGLLVRARIMGKGKEMMQLFQRDPDYLLCRGACVGLCNDGLMRHIWPQFIEEMNQKFSGFMFNNEHPNKARVVTKGKYILSIQDLENGDKVTPVFAIGPNMFTTNEQAGGVRIGTVDYVQPDRKNQALVTFGA